MHESGHKITLASGNTWGVAGAGGWTMIRGVEGDTPHILIPLNQIGGMTADEIGLSVLAAAEEARLAQAIDYAVTLLDDPGFDYLSGNAEELEKVIANAKAYLEEFRERDERIEKSAQLIERHEQRIRDREKRREHVKKQRSAATANYDKLLVKLGRRYGFKCLRCGSGDNLEVDHIDPVSMGGTSDLENLQILCRDCNAEKGAQRIDYRPSQDKL